MIKIIQEPDNWTAAYVDNTHKFYRFSYVGIAVLAASVGDPYEFIVPNSSIAALFKVGDTIYFGIDVVAKVTAVVGLNITTDIIRLILDPPTINTTFYYNNTPPLSIDLMVGRVTVGQPYAKLISIRVINRLGIYSINVEGYLQDVFMNLQPPPVVGVDNELFCNFKLVLSDASEVLIGTAKSCAYSTLEDLVTYTTGGDVLRVGDVESFNGKQSIYSRINGLTIETKLL